MRAETHRHSAKYGKGEYVLTDADLPAQVDEGALAKQIRGTLTSPTFRPPMLPAVAVEVLELCRRPNVGGDRVGALLERDPVLAGVAMRRVQSAVYASAMPVTSIRHAVTRLGLQAVRDIVLEAAFNLKVFRIPGQAATAESIRRHSASVAHVARLAARYTPLESENAFLLGLVHDVGLIGCLMALEASPKPPALTPEMWLGIGGIHEEVGAALARLWQLPADTQLAIGHHHRLKIQGQPHPLLALLSVAEYFAIRAGRDGAPALSHADALGGESASFERLQEAAEFLRLNSRHLELIEKEVPSILEKVA